MIAVIAGDADDAGNDGRSWNLVRKCYCAQLSQAEAYNDAANYALCENIVGKERHVTGWEWAYAVLACVSNLFALPAMRPRPHDRPAHPHL